MRSVVAVALTFALVGKAFAQEPPVRRLPVTVINALPDPPGARKIAGVVRDTGAVPIPDVEITIPSIARRAVSHADGSFRLEDVPPGKYEVRARKLGFAPQVRPVVVDSAGGVIGFTLLPVPYSLLPVVSSASTGGLSGVVGDTAYRAIRGADVRVVGHSPRTVTDSLGRFFIPLREGSYLVSFAQEGYTRRLVSVIVPPDSGRHVTVYLPPAKPIPVREAHNFDDFQERLSWRTQRNSRVYTRADLEEMGIEWVYDALNMAWGSICPGSSCHSSRDCSVIVNGGPATVSVSELTVDEIETLEVYATGGGSSRPASAFSGDRSRRGPPRMSAPLVPLTNTDRAAMQNATRNCTIAYVWLR